LPDQSSSASATPDSFFPFPNSPMSQRGREPSAATCLSPAEDSGGKCIKELKKYHSRCVTSVYSVHECM